MHVGTSFTYNGLKPFRHMNGDFVHYNGKPHGGAGEAPHVFDRLARVMS